MAQVQKSNTRNPISQSRTGFPDRPSSVWKSPAGSPFITLDRVDLRIRDRRILQGTCWQIRTGQQWAVTGPNGAGKSTLVRALAGQVPVVAGRIIRHRPGAEPGSVAVIGFDLQGRLLAGEERRAEARWFSDGAVAMTTVRRFLDPALSPIIEQFRLKGILDRDINAISTGERQRVLLARAVAADPGLLVLDEPFGGLDQETRGDIRALIESLMQRHLPVVIVAHRESDLPRGITHRVHVHRGRVVTAGPVDRNAPVPPHHPLPRKAARVSKSAPGPVLARMRNVSVAFGETVILDRIDWSVRCGEHWAITGPNGCGKTTLLSLITGEHLQGYANTIDLFGRPRGSGESIWEIRKHIGRISPERQFRYQSAIPAVEVVLSGFFSSVGLFRKPDDRQMETARTWIRRLGIEPLAPRPFDQLSLGEQRMVLLARAMVKSPRLLIMDEPCQGLDPANRSKILRLMDTAVDESDTTLLYVTHHADEACDCITHDLVFEPASGGGFRTVCKKR
jgi:molybdate transport system ATP-binding protein